MSHIIETQRSKERANIVKMKCSYRYNFGFGRVDEMQKTTMPHCCLCLQSNHLHCSTPSNLCRMSFMLHLLNKHYCSSPSHLWCPLLMLTKWPFKCAIRHLLKAIKDSAIKLQEICANYTSTYDKMKSSFLKLRIPTQLQSFLQGLYT